MWSSLNRGISCDLPRYRLFILYWCLSFEKVLLKFRFSYLWSEQDCTGGGRDFDCQFDWLVLSVMCFQCTVVVCLGSLSGALHGLSPSESGAWEQMMCSSSVVTSDEPSILRCAVFRPWNTWIFYLLSGFSMLCHRLSVLYSTVRRLIIRDDYANITALAFDFVFLWCEPARFSEILYKETPRLLSWVRVALLVLRSSIRMLNLVLQNLKSSSSNRRVSCMLRTSHNRRRRDIL